MEEEYWNKFFATGSVKDYLSYKMQESADEKGQMKEKSVGVSNCESDCTDSYEMCIRDRYNISQYIGLEHLISIEEMKSSTQNIVWFLRVPRVLLGGLVGAGLTCLLYTSRCV